MAHQFPDGSWGVRVQGVYRKAKEYPSSVDRAAGDGRYGFRTRPQPKGIVTVTAWDGQPLNRSGRKSAVSKQKAGCRLASRVQCAAVDMAEVQERELQRQLRRDLERAGRPRFRARRGQKPVARQ